MDVLRNLLICAAAASTFVAAATIRWTCPTTHNFGAFSEEMGPVSTVFRFVNIGSEPVSILAARASCGCTKPEYTHGEIAPGDTASVTVTYNPQGRPGTFSKYVQIETTDADAKKTRLIVKGTVVGAPLSVGKRFPVKLGEYVSLSRPAVMFGQVKKNGMRTAKLEAYNSSIDTLWPNVVAVPPYVDVDIAPARPAPGEQFAMVLYFRADEQPAYGLVSDSVAVDFGDGPHSIPLVAMVEEDFSALDDEQIADAPVVEVNQNVDLGIVEQGRQLSQTVKLKNVGKSVLKVRRVYSADTGVSATVNSLEIKPGKTGEIQVVIAPDATSGNMVNVRVMLITNDPRHSVLPIRLVGTIHN